MKTSRCATLLLALAAACAPKPKPAAPPPPAPPPSEPIVIAKKARQVGAKVTERTTIHVRVVTRFESAGKPSGGTDEEFSETEMRVEEIVAMKADAVTRARVSYPRLETTTVKDGQSKSDKPDARVGRSYVVEVKRGARGVRGAAPDVLPAVTRDGKRALASEADLVAKDASGALGPGAWVPALPERALSPGEKIDGLADALSRELARSEYTLSKPMIAARGQKGGLGIFDVAFDVAFEHWQSGGSATVTGELAVRGDGEWTKLVVSGPARSDAAPDDSPVRVHTDGKFELAIERTFE